MCGIAGIVSLSSPPRSRLLEMLAAIAHRGPDDEGTLFEERAGISAALGHKRLAVLDLSQDGRQPMTSQDGRWSITFSGEIFNYVELRRELDHIRFRSQTDTEVLLEACAAWGVEHALERSVGMFAFGLWDRQEQKLTLARDRIGEKPLVYFRDGSSLAFASEMKALRTFHDARLDPAAVDLYLALGWVPAPHGIFRDTRKLQAGHLLEWSKGRIAIRRWWYPERIGAPQGEVREWIGEATKLRLRADVPVAIALSGGVDSSIIAAEAARQGVSPDAFTVVFDGDETDLPYASLASGRFGMRHEVLRVGITGVAEAVRHYDEPFADSSAIASLALARALHGRYKVVLNGDGGDEAFGGYRHYEFIALKQMVKTAAAAAGFTDGRGRTGVYVQSKAAFSRVERQRLLQGVETRDSLGEFLDRDSFLQAAPDHALKHALWSDRHLYLANQLTTKMDIALSAYGIEGRAPFLDHRILEWAEKLAPRQLVRGRNKKALLREAYRGVLPREILHRPKHGFGAPITRWLTGPLRDFVRDALPCPLLAVQPQRGTSGQRLWTLLTFAHWAKAWGARW